MIDIVQADVLEWAKTYDGPKFHALLCDPPYELSFMSKRWDGTGIAFRAETWAALGEHLLPGAFCMAFASSRGYHRMACAIEDAGFRIFPMMLWVTGSSFPKSSRIDSQIDKAAGLEQPVIGSKLGLPGYSETMGKGSLYEGGFGGDGDGRRECEIRQPSTSLARVWAGHRYGGQALKDAATPICVFQKPYAGRPVDSITEYGSGALNIEAARIGTSDNLNGGAYAEHGTPRNDGWGMQRAGAGKYEQPAGRWPSNLLLQHAPGCERVGVKRVRGSDAGMTHTTADGWGMSAERRNTRHADADGYETVDEWRCVDGCPILALDTQAGPSVLGGTGVAHHKSNEAPGNAHTAYGCYGGGDTWKYSDVGGPSRFFQQCDYALEQAEPFSYNGKASRTEREAGLLGHAPCLKCGGYDTLFHVGKTGKQEACHRNGHPTQKPLSLAKYLSTLLLPPVEYAPRRILCPFFGTGSEGIGAHLAGFDEVLGIEMDAQYVEWARARVAHWCGASLPLFAVLNEAEPAEEAAS